MSPKVRGRVHAQRGSTAYTWCGRRIVGVEPHGQEVRRDHVTAKVDQVSCLSCLNNSGLVAERTR